MKKILSVLLVAILLFSFAGCIENKKPATPQNVQISDSGLITWDAVEGAIGYVVKINDSETSVSTNSYQVASVVNTFTYSIVTVGEGYKLSDPTETFTFEGKGNVPPQPDLSGVTVGIDGGSEVRSGKTLQLTANVSGAEDTSVTWSVTRGSDVVSVDENGLVTANEVSGDVVVEIQATSNANSEKFATKSLTVVAKPQLTQDMLDALKGERLAFDGYINITVYTIGPFPTVEATYSVVLRTMLDGTNWYAEYENAAGGKTALYCKNNDGLASQVGLSFTNEETYYPIKEADGTEITWEQSGYYNNFQNLTVEDFTFNEDTWRYEYNGDDDLPKKMIASVNPYDFVVNGFALIVEDGAVSGIYAKSGDDYAVAQGYRSVQELYVLATVDDNLVVPSITKYTHDELHDPLNQAIANMQQLQNYTMDFKEITASVYSSDIIEKGFVETITDDVMHFVPYDVTYQSDYTEIHTPDPTASYGYVQASDSLYNSYFSSEGKFVASRAYSGNVSASRPAFNFAAEIFTSYYEDEETGELYYYVDDPMCGVATQFYNCIGNDLSLYGIFAARGYTSSTSSFTPYVVVKDGYITKACFYFNMGLMYGVVELKYSNFNTTQTPSDVSFDGYEVRNVPTSWNQLTLQVTSDVAGTEEDVKINAAEYFAQYFGQGAADVPFFGNVLGDSYGFGMTTFRKPQSADNVKLSFVLYYDVPLDNDYTITTSLAKVTEYLSSLGFVRNSFGEYRKGNVIVEPVDNDLDLLIYVWTENPPAIS